MTMWKQKETIVLSDGLGLAWPCSCCLRVFLLLFAWFFCSSLTCPKRIWLAENIRRGLSSLPDQVRSLVFSNIVLVLFSTSPVIPVKSQSSSSPVVPRFPAQCGLASRRREGITSCSGQYTRPG
ncbi:hypothetical protein V1506DRAFT_548018 [Lipomyces tetrasporus]